MSDTIPQDIPKKQCTTCLVYFPATTEYFHVGKDTLYGLRNRCKRCQKDHDRSRYQARKESAQDIPLPGILFCQQCKTEQPIDRFHKNPTGRFGMASRCKDCAQESTENYYKSPKGHAVRKIYNKQRYAENKDIQGANHKVWYKNNRDYVLAKDRQFRKDHPEILSMRWKRWAKTERGYERCRIRVRNRQARRKGAGGNYVYADIEKQYNQQKGCCYYCNIKIGKGKSAYHVDHIVPISRGGSNDPSNLVLACASCNLSKGDKLLSEWPQGGKLL